MDLIQNPSDPSRLYSVFKEKLIARLTPSEEQRIAKILYQTEIGDQKPSEFHRSLIRLAGKSDEIGNKVIFKIFLDRLPKSIQRSLIPLAKLPLEEQLDIADKIWESENLNLKGVFSASASKSSSGIINPMEAEIAKIKNDLDQMKILFEKFINHMGNNYNNNAFHSERDRNFNKSQRNFNRSRSKDRIKSPESGEMCWYHEKFANKATKCLKPCKFFNSQISTQSNGEKN